MRSRIPVLLTVLALSLSACSDQIVEPEAGANPNGAYLSASPNAVQPQRNFTAPLSGRQEVPPNDSRGTGVAKFQLNKAHDEMSFKLNVSNLEGITQAHIHCGAAGVNGPVVVFLFGFVAEGVASRGTLSEGTFTNSDIIARPDSEVCPGGVANFDELLEKMRSGEAYVNVHTIDIPAGEIRGQI